MGQRLIHVEMLPAYIEAMAIRLRRDFDGIGLSSTRKAGTYFVKVARQLAPIGETGDLRRSIKAKFQKKSAIVSAGAANNKNAFDYSFFVDNKVKATKARMWFHQTRPSKPVGYRGVTGEGFWTATKNATQKEFREIILNDLSKIELIK